MEAGKMTTGINNTHQPSAEDFNNFSESVILYIKNKRDEIIKDERPVLKFLESCWQSDTQQFRNNEYVINITQNISLLLSQGNNSNSQKINIDKPELVNSFRQAIIDTINWRILNTWYEWAKDRTLDEKRSEALARVTRCLNHSDTRLDLSHLCLTTIPNDLPASITYLKLHGNRLEHLPSRLPFGLVSLYLNDNNLKDMPDNLPVTLKLLNISHNPLKITSEQSRQYQSLLKIFSFQPEQIREKETVEYYF